MQCVQLSILLVDGASEFSNLSMQVLHGLLHCSQLLRADGVHVLRVQTPGRGPELPLTLDQQLMLCFLQSSLVHGLCVSSVWFCNCTPLYISQCLWECDSGVKDSSACSMLTYIWQRIT